MARVWRHSKIIFKIYAEILSKCMQTTFHLRATTKMVPAQEIYGLNRK